MSNLQIGPRWQKLFYKAFIRNSAAEATGDNPACSLPCNLLRRFSILTLHSISNSRIPPDEFRIKFKNYKILVYQAFIRSSAGRRQVTTLAMQHVAQRAILLTLTVYGLTFADTYVLRCATGHSLGHATCCAGFRICRSALSPLFRESRERSCISLFYWQLTWPYVCWPYVVLLCLCATGGNPACSGPCNLLRRFSILISISFLESPGRRPPTRSTTWFVIVCFASLACICAVKLFSILRGCAV